MVEFHRIVVLTEDKVQTAKFQPGQLLDRLLQQAVLTEEYHPIAAPMEVPVRIASSPLDRLQDQPLLGPARSVESLRTAVPMEELDPIAL